jgi:hypothetical protein
MSVAFRPAGRSDNGTGKGGGGPVEVAGAGGVRGFVVSRQQEEDKFDNAQNKNKTNLITSLLVRMQV